MKKYMIIGRVVRFQSTVASVPRFYGQHALITGGSTGIGYAIAHKLASMGCKITLASRNTDRLQEKKVQLDQISAQWGVEHSHLSLDMTDLNGLEKQIKSNEGLLKDVNILVNNAGMSQVSLIERTSTTNICDIVNCNLTSAILLSKLISYFMNKKSHSLRRSKDKDNTLEVSEMPANGNKHIINISSALANVPMMGAVAYSTSKAGLVAFTKSYALEVARQGIRCNAILPGWVPGTDIGKTVNKTVMEQRTVLQESGDLTAEDIADACVFILDSGKMTGQSITIDKGFSIG